MNLEVTPTERSNDKGPQEIRVLVLSKELTSHGGVAGFVGMLFRRISPRMHLQHFVIGRRLALRRLLIGPLMALIDVGRLNIEVRRRTYDVIHLNPSLNWPALLRDGLFILALRSLSNVRILVFIHGWSDNTASTLTKNSLARWCFMRSFGRADRIVVLAEQFRRQLLTLGVSANRVCVMTTMFDGHEYPQPEHSRVWHGGCVLFFGRLEVAKGIHQTLEAFRLLVSRCKSVRLIIAGTGSEDDAVRNWIQRNHFESCVEFVGFVRGREKFLVLQRADVFVLPTSWGEGCPVSLLEAMAAGLSIVTTAVGGIPDIVRHPENGIILRSIDPDEIAAALHQLVANPKHAMEIGRRNSVKAWVNYEAGVVTAQLESIYGQITSNASDG